MVFPDLPYNEACLKANLPKLSERRDMLSQNLFDNIARHKDPYMSNTGNLTPTDKYTFRWFRWIHRTNKSSVGETFFR